MNVGGLSPLSMCEQSLRSGSADGGNSSRSLRPELDADQVPRMRLFVKLQTTGCSVRLSSGSTIMKSMKLLSGSEKRDKRGRRVKLSYGSFKENSMTWWLT